MKILEAKNLQDFVRETDAEIREVTTYKYFFIKVSKQAKYTYFVNDIPYKGNFAVSPKTELPDTIRVKYLETKPTASVPSEYEDRVFRSLIFAVIAGLGFLALSYYFLYDYPFYGRWI